MTPAPETVVTHTRCWIERVVIALNLCPFARRPYEGGRVRYQVSSATTPEDLLLDLDREFQRLRASDPAELETTLLIHPWVLTDFLDYNDFLDAVEGLIVEGDYDGEFQVASLHPDYQFAGTDPGDAENFTNRSPYPTLHLLREAGLARALESYPDPEQIPERNIETMERLGAERMGELLAECKATPPGDRP